jgi:hypothetical protein
VLSVACSAQRRKALPPPWACMQTHPQVTMVGLRRSPSRLANPSIVTLTSHTVDWLT